MCFTDGTPYQFYFSSCATILCMDVFLRSDVIVSNLVVKAINIGYELLTLLGVKCFTILSHIPWGDIISLRKVCHDLGHIVTLVF
jgi:hypothetical protein